MNIIEIINETWDGANFAQDSAEWAGIVVTSEKDSLYRQIHGDGLGFFTMPNLEYT